MQLKVLDLFAGCGGLSLGLSQAGYSIVAACEKDQWAADSYRENHDGVEVIQEDISKVKGAFWKRYKGKVDVVAGGPPCQGFSVSGKRQYGVIADTNSLVTDYLRVVQEVDPSYVVVENVKGFKTGSLSKNKKVFDYLKGTLEDLGYYVYYKTLNAEEYGVPSLRSRIFVIASKYKFRIDPFPKPTHSQESAGGLKSFVSVMDAISDLPELEAREGVEEGQAYRSKGETHYQRQMRKGSKLVFNHVAMNHTPRLVERFKNMEQGHTSYRIGRETSEKKVTSYKTNNQKLYAKKPSLCITANFQSTFVHPEQHRNLTAREAARLMSFPDTFIFKGKRTQMSSKFLKKYGRENEDFLSQYNQIGNAVPPLLGKAVGKALLRAINSGEDVGGACKKEEQLALSL